MVVYSNSHSCEVQISWFEAGGRRQEAGGRREIQIDFSPFPKHSQCVPHEFGKRYNS